MRNRILLGTLLGALGFLVFAESAQAQQIYVQGGRGGFSAGYGPAYGYGYYGPSYGYRGYGWSSYYGPSYGYYYGGYPYRSYYSSPYVYSSPYGYTSYSWRDPVYSGSYYYAAPAQPAPTVVQSPAIVAQPAPTVAEGRLSVTLPTADARLWIENVQMRQQGTQRIFATPPLEAGKTYTYNLRASWMEGDREMTRDRQVIVRAGEETPVSFREVAARR